MTNLPTKEDLVTIKEVADILKVSTKHITLKIKKMFPHLLQNGVKTYLNEKEVTAIKIEIEKNPYLDQSVKVRTDLEKELIIKQALVFQDEKIESLNKYISEIKSQNKELYIENNQLKPKAEFYDTVTGSKDTIDIGQVSKLLNKRIGRNRLFELLRKNKILDRKNIPYQKFVDRGYFRIIESDYTRKDGSSHINLKTVVYQKGIDFINKILRTNI